MIPGDGLVRGHFEDDAFWRAVIGLAAALPAFLGTIMQRPPAYSALHVDGRRAYALARAGSPPDLAPRPIEIYELRLLEAPNPDFADFEALVAALAPK